MNFKNLCVYCGSSFNGDLETERVLEQLACAFISNKFDLVYGGGSVGLMGLLADLVLSKKGTVRGVIPQFLLDKEVGHTGLTEMIITQNMHQRKQKMADLSDGFIILPGGFGTMEEFFEVLTWLQLGLHTKPVGILNINGFYNHLFLQFDVMVEHGFLKQANRDLIFSDEDPVALINKMKDFAATPEDKWFRNEI